MSSTVHHDVLARLVDSAGTITSGDLYTCYDAVAPLAYEGRLETPVTRRHCRTILHDLARDGRITAQPRGNSYQWQPARDD